MKAASIGAEAAAAMLAKLSPRELGPTTMGGRVMDVAVYEKEPRYFYVGFASGGLWRTDNGGTTMTPVFDKQNGMSIGAVAVSPIDPNFVVVGTGEDSSRNSSSWGNGLYISKDGGANWELSGLGDSGAFGRIAFNPKDSKIILAAAVGPLWAEGGERGIYRSSDAGKTWKKVVDVGPKAGGIDVVFNPKNPNVVLAATWERVRLPYNFYSRGKGAGIWKSTDAGTTWKRVTKGLPKGDLGRIGLSVFAANPKVWIAMVDHQEGGVYRSEDEGESWTKVNALNPRPFYFSVPMQDPQDEDTIYVLGVGIHKSTDRGKTFREMATPLHSDHHTGWIDPDDNNHIIFGNDGGVGQSRDKGKTWSVIDTMPAGQFYAVATDMRKPYWVYGGLQDNGSWGGPTQTRRGGVAFYDWAFMQGGDGFHMQVDQTDWRWVYGESQGGALSRLDQKTGVSRGIRPNPTRLGEPANTRYRFNWSSPFILSPFNQATIYFGGNKLFKSVDRGDTWKAVSPDLTTNDPKKLEPVVGDAVRSGAEMHCTIITLNESPMAQGLLWVGTDDGLVHVSRDDGANWTDVTKNFNGVPANTWVSRVRPSRFAEGRCYVTFDGHRTGDFKPYGFVTEDFGATWAPLGTGLEDAGSCYVVTEGTQNENLLFVGAERGLFVSLDRGKTFTKLTAGKWPNVRTDDCVIQPRELDLVVATHGRSFWTIDISALEQLSEDAFGSPAALMTPQTVYQLGFVPGRWFAGQDEFGANNTQPGTTFWYHLKEASKEKVRLIVTDAAGREVASIDGQGDAGLNAVSFRIQRGRIPNKTTDYTVTLKIGDKEAGKAALRVENLVENDDPNVFIP